MELRSNWSAKPLHPTVPMLAIITLLATHIGAFRNPKRQPGANGALLGWFEVSPPLITILEAFFIGRAMRQERWSAFGEFLLFSRILPEEGTIIVWAGYASRKQPAGKSLQGIP